MHSLAPRAGVRSPRAQAGRLTADRGAGSARRVLRRAMGLLDTAFWASYFASTCRAWPVVASMPSSRSAPTSSCASMSPDPSVSNRLKAACTLGSTRWLPMVESEPPL